MYDPLYSPNVGLGGFRCRECARVTRTERGIKSHYWIVHGKKVQIEFSFTRPDESVPEASGTGTNSSNQAEQCGHPCNEYLESGSCKCTGYKMP